MTESLNWAPETSFFQEWSSIIISVTFIVVGWAVLYRNAQKLATRSETKSILDTAFVALQSITDSSMHFWMAEPVNKSIAEYEMNMRYMFTKLSQSIDLLNQRGLEIDSVQVSDLLDTCTLNCEKRSDIKFKERMLLSNTIAADSINLYQDLMNSFHKTYKPNLPLIKSIKKIFFWIKSFKN